MHNAHGCIIILFYYTHFIILSVLWICPRATFLW